MEWDGDRDQKRIEKGALRHLLVGLGLRPSFGQYFRNLSEEIPPETVNMLSKPETYTGAAAAKAREIAKSAETYLKAQSP